MQKLVIRKSELSSMNFLNAETIEKARKGEQASGHKYIWRKPKAKGGYDYIYAEDQVKRPLEMLVKWFSFTKDKISALYKKNNIEKDYKATEKDFSAHLLEYIVHRNKWDKKFADKGEQQKFNKKVTMDQIKEVEKTGLKNPVTEGTPTEEKKQPGKPEKPLFKPNTYLMRKIWSMYTGKAIEEEKKVQYKAESEFIAAQAETVEEEKPVSEDVKNEADTLVRVAINTNMMIENRYKADKSEKTDDKIKSLKKLKSQIVQNEKRKVKRIEELRNYNAWNDSGLGFYDGSFIKKEDVEREIKEFDDNNAVIDWNTETINIIDKEIENLKNETKEQPKNTVKVEYRDGIKKEAQEILDDYASNKTPKYTLEERNKIINSSKALKWIVEHAKPVELENPSKRAIVEIGNSPIFEKVNGAFSGKVPYAMNKNIVKEIHTINTGSYDPTKDHLGDKSTTLEYYDENGNEVVETFYLQKPTYSGDPYKMSYTIRVFDKEKTKDVAEKIVNGEDFEVPDTKNEFEEWLNRHNAMLGNDNAKKDGIIPEGENNYGKDNSNTESDGISGGISDLRRTGSTDSTGNVYITGDGSNEEQLSSSALQPGIGLKEPETTNIRSIGRIGDGSGKLTNGQAIKIRDACHKLLAEKTDSEMTADDKALLAQFVGAGGIKDKNNKRDNNGVLYEFYTPRAVVNKVWQLVDKYLPQKDKTCIEPSSGIGRFAENRTEKFTMFEFEEDSARIAKILHPEAEVVQGAFEKNFIRDGRFAGKNFQKFDCAVGNPPYGDYTGFYKGQGEGKEFARYDQYFVSRTLDTLKDNGILAFVMPSNFLSSDDPKFKKAKEIIASKGKLLEAWRLPNGVFQLDVKSGTNVGTDIIIIRKEKGDVNDFIGDNYFKNNPNHIAGDVVEQINFRGQPEKVVQPKNGEDFESAVNNIDINDVEAIIKELPKAETIIEEKPKVDTVTAHNNRSNAMKGNKNAAGKHNFVASTGKNMTATEFNQKYGKNIDPKEMEIWRFTDYAGNIDTTKLTADQMDYIQKSDRYVKDGQKIVNVVNYASGNIREKLDDLEIQLKSKEITEEDYNKKKLILETVLPPTKEIGQFQLSPLSDWTRKYVTKDGMSLIQGFYDWVFNGNPDLSERELPIDSPVEEERIPAEISFGDVIDYIEKKPLTIGRGEADNAKDKAKLRYRKSEKRRDTAEMLFNEYLKEGLSPEDREDLTKAWNDNFNSFVNPNYEQIPIFIDGMNENMGTTPFTLTEQQLKGISFLVNKGSGLLAYDVGVGKTVTGLCATVNQIQTGRSKRPLICVPNSVYENWIAEIHQHFPDLKVNELRNFGKDYISKDWKPEEGSLSICTYEALQKITFHDDTLEEIHQDVEFAKLQKSSGKESERQAAKKSEKLKELVGSMSKTSGDDSVYFEDLGFDHITVDECFPYNTKVLTEKGWCEIGRLLDEKVERVYSYNCVTKELELKKITAFMPKELNHKVIKLNLSNGGYLVCTHNHKIYIEGEGYVKAEETLGKNVSVLSENILGGVQIQRKKVLLSNLFSKKSYKGETNKNLSYMQEGISIQEFWRESKCKKDLLLKSLCSYLPESESRNNSGCQGKGACNGRCIERAENARTFYQDEGKQSYEESRGQIEGCKFKEGYTNKKSWWKRPFNRTTNNIIETLTGISSRISNKNGCGKESNGKSSSLLQAGFSLFGNEISNRIRWIFSRFSKNQTERPKEGRLFEFVRVESIEILEPGSYKQYGFRSSEDKTVYDITVEDNHNFIAEGMIVSNCHNFKNIFYVPRNMNVNVDEDTVTRESNEFNALQGSRSDRGEKLFAITQYIQRHNDNRNVFGLSATPFQNSPIEIYNILSLFARQRMKELSIYSLEEFVKQFALLKSEYAVKANTIEEKMVMKSFKNLAALQNLITEYIDKVDGGEAHVIRPKKQVHLPKLEMTELQRQIMDAESAYITQQSLLPKKDRDPGAILASLNAMRMATLSPALVHEGRYEIYQSLGYDIEKPKDKDVVTSSPKLQFVCDSVIKQYKAAPKEGQVIYMPRGVTQYKYVVDYLVKNGVPADAIATMAGGNGEKALIERENKTHEFNDVNGKCKIIIGSESIKEGVNLNGNSTTLYNTMLGWNPSETTQVEGRIWRQGNKQGITHIVYPLLNDSIDPMMYQKYDEKKNRIDNLFSYKGDTMNVEEINPEELKFGLIKDPKKRADVQTRQYKEQSESEYKMYNKLIEVLERQGQIAFNDPTQTKEYKDIQFNIDKDQKLYDVFKASRKQWEDKYNSGDANTKALAAKQIESNDKYLTAQKKKIDAEKRSLKKLENSRNNMLDTLKRKGIKDMADLEKKVGEYQKLAIIASNNMDNAAEMFDTYYKQAVEDNEKNKINLLPLKDQVEAYTKEIRDNLHPMDEAWKAMLREENEKQFKKSIPLFLIKGGRFLIRK